MSVEKDNKDKEIKVKPKDFKDNPEVEKPKPPINEELVKLFKPESDAITHNNMAKLTKQDAFEIANKTFNRRRLKPKELLQFTKSYSEVTEAGESELEQKLIAMEQSAMIALEDFTKEDFENTDVVVLENILAACFLITKGFREV